MMSKRRKKKQGGAFGSKATTEPNPERLADLIKRTVYAYWAMTLSDMILEATETKNLLLSGCLRAGYTVELQWSGRVLDFVIRRQSDGLTWFSGTIEEAGPGKPPGSIPSIRKSVSSGIPSEVYALPLN